MVTFGEERFDWLSDRLSLPNGIPSHDTFSRVLQMVDPEQLRLVLTEDAARFIEHFKGAQISVDGKKIHGQSPTSKGNRGMYILSAWVGEHKLCIGQAKVADKTNELGVLPDLLRSLELSQATVSIDAAGCHTHIAQQIIDQQGDYLLAVKSNQQKLLQEMVEAFTHFPASGRAEQWEYGHGRAEIRRCRVLKAKDSLGTLISRKWAGITHLLAMTTERAEGGISSTYTRYYISSHDVITAEQAATMIRSHWSIENDLHWHLDVTFNEDASRVRAETAAQNLNTLRKVALQRIRRDSSKLSLKKRRFKASMNMQYLDQLLLL